MALGRAGEAEVNGSIAAGPSHRAGPAGRERGVTAAPREGMARSGGMWKPLGTFQSPVSPPAGDTLTPEPGAVGARRGLSSVSSLCPQPRARSPSAWRDSATPSTRASPNAS